MNGVTARLNALENAARLGSGIHGASDGELWRAALPGVDLATVDRDATDLLWATDRDAFHRGDFVDVHGKRRARP